MAIKRHLTYEHSNQITIMRYLRASNVESSQKPSNPACSIFNPTSLDYLKWIMRKWRDEYLESYHVTTIYKERSDGGGGWKTTTPSHTASHLQRSLPAIISHMIGSNWKTAYSFRDCLWMFSFLDEPGSRRRRAIKTISPADAQDTFHHHSILLVKGGIDQIIDARLFGSVVDSRRWGLEPEVNLAKETIALTPMRSCNIQRLYKKENLEKACLYAAKRYLKLQKQFPDDECVLVFSMSDIRNLE